MAYDVLQNYLDLSKQNEQIKRVCEINNATIISYTLRYLNYLNTINQTLCSVQLSLSVAKESLCSVLICTKLRS